jgi:hypothetical protein
MEQVTEENVVGIEVMELDAVVKEKSAKEIASRDA